MVKAFQFARLPKIIFRKGSISELPDLTGGPGKAILLITGRKSFLFSENGKILLENLREKEIPFYQFIIAGEPSPAMINEAVDRFRNNSIEWVVAIGGGSVLDAGKAISAMLKVPGSVKDFLEGVGDKKHPGTKVNFIAVPTTSGTGSEATKNAVISEPGPQGFKKSLRHDHFVPEIALVDPELTTSCPPEITAASGMDCFTQLTEAFLSERASDYTDAFARLGLKAIRSSLLQTVKDGNDIEAREDMSFAALNSGICLANAGLGTIHGMASVIGGMFNIPHGLVCGTLMAPGNRVNIRELRRKDPHNPALRKYAELGRLFLGTEKNPDNYYIDGFVAYLYELTSEIGLPDLSGHGIEEKDVPQICKQAGNKNNPVRLTLENMKEILSEKM